MRRRQHVSWPLSSALRRCATAASAQQPRELQFFADFAASEHNLHEELLQEANAKHAVTMEVPPQLPPKVDPPNVPEPIFAEALRQFLDRTDLKYAPTHDPPPLSTTGVGNLVLMAPAAAQAAASASGASASPATSGDVAEAVDPMVEVYQNVEETVPVEVEVEENQTPEASADAEAPSSAAAAPSPTEAANEPQRAPIEKDKKFHCSACGKPFRLKLAAQHHITAKHDGDAAATVLEGPGPGEIMEDGGPASAAAAPAAPKIQAQTIAQASRKKKITKMVKKLVQRRVTMKKSEATNLGLKILRTLQEPVVGKKAAKAEKRKLEEVAAAAPAVPGKSGIELPSEEEIRDLLLSTWDVYGAQVMGEAFKSTGDVVSAMADKRKPIDPDEPVKESASATPAYARKPEKKAVQPPSAPGTFTPIVMLSAQYPNPFGDTKSFTEDDDDPAVTKNPFISAPPAAAEGASEEGAAASAAPSMLDSPKAPSLSRASAQKPFVCPKCGAAFRTMDGLLKHHEKIHGASMSMEERRKCRTMRPAGAIYGVEAPESKQPPASAEEKTSAVKTGEATGAADGQSGGDTGADSGTASPGVPDPIPVADVGVHLRMSANAVMVGTVRSVSEGFIGAVPVTQLVLAVDDAEEGQDANVAFTELITVRCFGPACAKQVQMSAKVGSRVFVEGTLKLNRRLDPVSKRNHAYPYLQVSPPFGNVLVMEQSWSAGPTSTGAAASSQTGSTGGKTMWQTLTQQQA